MIRANFTPEQAELVGSLLVSEIRECERGQRHLGADLTKRIRVLRGAFEALRHIEAAATLEADLEALASDLRAEEMEGVK